MNESDPNRPDDANRPQEHVREDLKATADSIRTDVGRLNAIEDAKQTLDAEDPAIDRLSDEAVALADRIGRQTRGERQLSEDLG
jgi:hypothetical protein